MYLCLCVFVYLYLLAVSTSASAGCSDRKSAVEQSWWWLHWQAGSSQGSKQLEATCLGQSDLLIATIRGPSAIRVPYVNWVDLQPNLYFNRSHHTRGRHNVQPYTIQDLITIGTPFDIKRAKCYRHNCKLRFAMNGPMNKEHVKSESILLPRCWLTCMQ